jgi:D-2-hydroxyacid dehydrogenase (NADP+)
MMVKFGPHITGRDPTSMPEVTRIVTTVDLDQKHIDRLTNEFSGLEVIKCPDPSELGDYLPGVQGVIGRGLTAEFLQKFPDVIWAHSPGAGVDSFLFPELIDSNVVVTNNSGVHANTIAEHLLGMMLAFTRGFPEMVRNQQKHLWQRPSTEVVELSPQTLAVVGLGDIGYALAVRAKALGMHVVGSRRRSQEPMERVDEIYSPDQLHEMIAKADHVAITLPSTAKTRGLFGTPEFEAMKESAIIYNIGRGDIIKQDELIDALNNGLIAGAGLDVTTPEPLNEDSPLWDTPGVFITPHYSGSTPYYWDRGIEIVAENIRRLRNDETLFNVVDKKEGY